MKYGGEILRKLAVSDEILMQVEKPARYIGNEVNMVVKDPSKVDIRFCMCFPDVYEIGMSHLGLRILYDLYNRRKDTYCERVFAPYLVFNVGLSTLVMFSFVISLLLAKI